MNPVRPQKAHKTHHSIEASTGVQPFNVNRKESEV